MSSIPLPINRLIEYTVLSGFSTACDRASLPTVTRRSGANAITDGTSPLPDASRTTTGPVGVMYAPSEFVVPRSMPRMTGAGFEVESGFILLILSLGKD